MRMNMSPTEEKPYAFVSDLEIIDCHEHLAPESACLAEPADVTNLFSHYTRTDLICAGMTAEQYEKMVNTRLPLEDRWPLLKAHLAYVRHGSYARPAFIAAQRFYGFGDITEDNYRQLSERMQADHTPGIYNRILRDACRIKTCLTQFGGTEGADFDLLTPVMPLRHYAVVASAKELEEKGHALDITVQSLEDYLELSQKGLEAWKRQGVPGIKMMLTPQAEAPADARAAEGRFTRIRDGQEVPQAGHDPLEALMTHQILEWCGEIGLVVAVHSGMWGDFRDLEPKRMLKLAPQHLGTRFDLYHLGMPNVREAMVVAKNNPNVWLNLAWCHVISQRLTVRALDEVIDLVPMNKILGFGGDYSPSAVCKVYGHLIMAREDIAEVLARRIERGLMDMDEAEQIIQWWMLDNPKHLYGLEV